MLSITQCREILENGHLDMPLNDDQVEQIRDFLSLLADIELETLLNDITNTQDSHS